MGGGFASLFKVDIVELDRFGWDRIGVGQEVVILIALWAEAVFVISAHTAVTAGHELLFTFNRFQLSGAHRNAPWLARGQP